MLAVVATAEPSSARANGASRNRARKARVTCPSIAGVSFPRALLFHPPAARAPRICLQMS
eukprot:1248810-Prymnesium_polylepis.1